MNILFNINLDSLDGPHSRLIASPKALQLITKKLSKNSNSSTKALS